MVNRNLGAEGTRTIAGDGPQAAAAGVIASSYSDRSTAGDDGLRARSIFALVACGLVALLDGADAQSFAIAAPLIAEAIGMPVSSTGLIFSCSAFGSMLGYLVGGMLADRVGAKATVVIAAVAIGVFQILTAQVHTVGALVAVRIAASAGLGGAVPALVILVARIAPKKWGHRPQGLLWACFPLGVLTGGLVNGWILTHATWQTVFLAGGVAPLVVAALLWLLVPSGERRPAPDLSQSFSLQETSIRGSRFWHRAMLTGLIFLCANGFIAVILSWTPSLLARVGHPPATGGHALAWNAAGALASMTLAGFIVERSRIVPVIVGLAVATVSTVLLASALHSLTAVMVLMVFLGATAGLSGTAAVFVAAQLSPGANQASVIGVCMAVGRVGQVIFPGLVGLWLQAGQTPGTALLVAALLPFAGSVAALSLWIVEREKRSS